MIRLGLIGIGVGARQLLPALTRHPNVRLRAAADVRPGALQQLEAEFGVATYSSVAALCAQPDIDAVWVASPNHLHAEHAIAAAEHGKHVIVSKPMAVNMAEADAMVSAAERAGVVLLAGHSQASAPTIRRMGDMVRGGQLGALGMLHTWHFTDWMHRPRLPEELDTRTGGGPVFRQASHQVDIVRAIAGRRLRAVRASTIQLDPARSVPGAYTVYLEFEDGTPATIVYSGYGNFDVSAFLRGSDDELRRSSDGTRSDAERKEALRYGANAAGAETLSRPRNTLGLFGLTVVSCAHGDLRESLDGLYLYTRAGRQEIRVEDEPRGQAELDELYAAAHGTQPAVHDGRWGAATLEVCLAIHESAARRGEVLLTRQS
jgi:phthalate 4,5-cis-dihydrodiol dehydrogenase